MPRPDQESSKALGRALEAMLAQGLSEARLGYFIEKPDVGGGAAEAVATRREINPGVWRETLEVSTRRPMELSVGVAQLTRVRVDGIGGRISYLANDELSVAKGAEPAFAHALCQAVGRALAPSPPSLADRLMRKRHGATASVDFDPARANPRGSP